MSRIKKSLIFIGITLFIFFLYRLALFSFHYDIFSSLGSFAVCNAFFGGIRFDLSIILTFFALPLLMMNLPVSHAKHKLWFGFWGMMLYLFVVVATLLLIGDVVYYASVKRHMGRELLSLSNDYTFIFDMVASSYKFLFVLFLFYALALLLIWVKILLIDKAPLKKPIIKFVLLILILFLGIRGTVDRKAINIIDAFTSGNTAYGNLCLNGVFTTYHSVRHSSEVDHHHFDEERLYDLMGLQKDEYPMLRSYPGKKKGYNIVFVLMESWGFDYIDSFGGNNFGVTPNFDSLAKEGMKFVNFYAAGQRSIEGIQATLTGIPPLKGAPHIGIGLEVSNFTKIGGLAKKNGYRTLFLQSSRRRSFRVDAVAKAAGFEEYYGMEDMPILLDYSDPKAAKFGWDYETYMLLNQKLEETDRPFFAYMFTGTTHTPYPDLGEKFQKYPHNPNEEGGYLNSLYYSDWSLGEFMKEMKSKPWFDKTIFIFTADHVTNYVKEDSNVKFHIPLLIYAPEILEPRTIKAVGSQFDLMPTIIDLLGFNDEFASIGESLFRKKDDFAFVSSGDIIGGVTDRGYLTHTLKNRIQTISFKKDVSEEYFKGLENRLLALDQISYELLQSNRWAK